MEGAVPVLVQEKKLGTELSPADFDGARPDLPHECCTAATVLSIDRCSIISDETEKHIRIGGRFVQKVRCQ